MILIQEIPEKSGFLSSDFIKTIDCLMESDESSSLLEQYVNPFRDYSGFYE